MVTGEPIKAERYLFGIRWWAHWRPAPFEPRLEVYEYVGQQPKAGLFWFRGRRMKAHISLKFSELNTPTFRPFLLDLSRAHAWLGGEEVK